MICIAGPTGVGKTAVSFHLADALDAEIVSADSMQVYRRMDIGTAKPSVAEQALVPHHLIDVVEPDDEWTLANYQAAARAACERVERGGKVPLVVGGTGLYVRALTTELDIPTVTPNDSLRAEWRKQAEECGNAALQAELAKVDPVSAARIHVNDIGRLIRALEVHTALGIPLSQLHAENKARQTDQTATLIGLNYADRRILYANIETRVDRMIAEGLVAEVRGLMESGYSRDLKPMRSLGYRQISEYLAGECALVEAVDKMKRETRHFARRQLIWFRADPRVQWVMADSKTPDVIAAEILTLLDRSINPS